MMSVQSNFQSQGMQNQQCGQGGGKGGNSEMREIMQSLSPEDRSMMREKMASLSSDEKVAMKEKLSEVDTAGMSQEELSKTFLDILNESDDQTRVDTEDYLLSVYA